MEGLGVMMRKSCNRQCFSAPWETALNSRTKTTGKGLDRTSNNVSTALLAMNTYILEGIDTQAYTVGPRHGYVRNDKLKATQSEWRNVRNADCYPDVDAIQRHPHQTTLVTALCGACVTCSREVGNNTLEQQTDGGHSIGGHKQWHGRLSMHGVECRTHVLCLLLGEHGHVTQKLTPISQQRPCNSQKLDQSVSSISYFS